MSEFINPYTLHCKPWKCKSCVIKLPLMKDGNLVKDEAGNNVFIESPSENSWFATACYNCKAPRHRPNKLEDIANIRKLLISIESDPYILEQEKTLIANVHCLMSKLEHHYNTELNIIYG